MRPIFTCQALPNRPIASTKTRAWASGGTSSNDLRARLCSTSGERWHDETHGRARRRRADRSERNPPTPAGHIFAINEGRLTGRDGGSLARVDLSGHTLILSADHPDKAAYPTRTVAVKAATLPDILVGEVVWVGRRLGRGTRR